MYYYHCYMIQNYMLLYQTSLQNYMLIAFFIFFSPFLSIYVVSFIQILFQMWRVAIVTLFLLIASVDSLKFVVSVSREQGTRCFFQALTINEKYFFQAISRTHQNYRLQIHRSIQNNKYDLVFSREANSVVESISKFAPMEGTYMFCISNPFEEVLRAQITIMTGLELVNLNYLPTNTDQQNLHRQIDWLQSQKKKLLQILTRIQGVRTSTQDLNSQVSLKYIIFAVLGLLGVIGVNFVFYSQTKKTLKDRKLI